MAQKPQQTPKPRPIRDVRMSDTSVQAKGDKTQSKRRRPKLPKSFSHPKTRRASIIAAAFLVGLFIWAYMQTRNELGKDETTKLTAEISRFLELPGEVPTLATVKNADKLKSQPFFKSTQDGDKVLIYSQAGRAVLYRPETKKVIEYSSITLGTPSQ